ncbi:MAG: hypothetical protein Ct9H300mP16_13530 [Pseudomonadota bacterium]|nr:MAG: hypothetical protein Ct9H300mP16_13530 [Pseudomonadota bacterium]
MIEAYIELKAEEVERLLQATHPVEFDLYYSVKPGKRQRIPVDGVFSGFGVKCTKLVHTWLSMAHPLSDQILDEQTTAVLLVDSGPKVVYLNAAAQVLLDISAQRAMGRLADELLGISAPLQAALTDSAKGV